jgi:hypothetical protein
MLAILGPELWLVYKYVWFIPDEGENSTIEQRYFETNVSDLIQLRNEGDILLKRNKLIEFLWGQEGFPDTLLPDRVEKNVIDETFGDLKNLKQIDAIHISMEWGVNSIAYHFIPVAGNGELFIYHHGHGEGFSSGIATIEALLNAGYSVIGMSMPLVGLNNQPVVHLERFGRLKLTSHDHLKFLKMEHGHPLKLFIQPVAVVLNYARQEYGYSSIHMAGISGGGWTTTVYAAIDPRISHSYPAAGSLPLYLRSEIAVNWGDYEQLVPEFYEIANYLELYILGAYGAGRRQLQILNQHDACCFAGTGYRTYETVVKERVDALGLGKFEVYLDSSHKEHKISEQAIKMILEDARH